MTHPGSSIRAAKSFNMHIVALEKDASIFEEVLRRLMEAATRPSLTRSQCIEEDEDNDEDLPEADEVNLCE